MTKTKKEKGMDYNFAELYPNTKMLSSSQVITYEKDPKQFYLEYVLGVRRKASQPMFVGKVFSAGFADRKFDWRKSLDSWNNGKGVAPKRLYDLMENALKAMPLLPKKDCEYPLKCKFMGWEFRASLDGIVPADKIIIENKTGQVPWTQYRADESDQITFQNWCYWKKNGELSSKTILYWVSTGANSRQLIMTFNTKRTLTQLREFEKRIEAVVGGINAENFTNAIYN